VAKAIVVAGGSPPPAEWARPLLQAAEILVCADSGLRLCRQCGLLPHLLVGDLDSLLPSEWQQLPPLLWGVEQHPPEKDQSDLELALVGLARRYQGPVALLGALGGRLDHTLFNLCSALFLALDLGLDPQVRDPDLSVFPLRQSLTLHDQIGASCSILPLGEGLEGVTLEGFRYGLRDQPLWRRSTRGLSNRVEEALARITVTRGEALVIVHAQS